MRYFRLWIRNRIHGTRRELYNGGSLTKARELANSAMQIANEFRLTCTIVIYDRKGEPVLEHDFWNGDKYCSGFLDTMPLERWKEKR